ncbi:acyltransferase [bacterium]|nr:acyltransferase [bacterium]
MSDGNHKPHFPALDGLRALAVALVLLGHTTFENYRPKEFASLGVHLFFVLSGFLITALLLRESEATGRIDLRAFFVRRVLRIFPAYYAFLGTLAALIGLGWITDVPWYSWAASALFVANIWGRGTAVGHTWSLSLEEQFYLAWPTLFLLLGSSTRRLQAAIAGILAIWVLRISAIALGWSDYETGAVYMRPWFRFDSLILGCALALAYTPRGTWEVRRTPFSLVWVAPLLVAWSVWAEKFFLGRVLFTTVQGLLCGAFLLALMDLQKRPAWARVFEHATTRWLAALSYPLYLWQQIFLYPAQRGILESFVLTFGVAAISYYGLERPILRKRRALSEARPSPQPGLLSRRYS